MKNFHEISGLEGEVIIFHAGSLSRPFDAVAEKFKKLYPGLQLVHHAGGSVALARRITLREMPVDIFASADCTVIDKVLIPVYTDWYVCFAANEMVLCYTEKSRYADKVGPENWYRILARPQVAWEHTDPDLDPCGYRSLMVMQLAELYYQQSGLYRSLLACRPKGKVRPNAAEMIAKLKEGALDYAFEYLSVAVQHNLRYIKLPREINLGDPELNRFYAGARVAVSGAPPETSLVKVGQSCTFGVTLLTGSPNPRGAEAFLSCLLDKEGGLQILREMGPPPLDPLLVPTDAMKAKLPATLRERVKVFDRMGSGKNLR